MNFNLAEVPFSRFGSYMAIDQLSSSEKRAAGVYVRTLHGDATRAEVCRIELLSGGHVCDGGGRAEPVHSDNICAAPSLLRIAAGLNHLDFCFSDPNTLRLRGSGIGLRLSFDIELYDSVIAWQGGWLINSFSNRMRYALIVDSGVMSRCEKNESEACWVFECASDAADIFEIALSEAPLHWPQHSELFAQEFFVCQRAVEQEFDTWLQATPSVPTEFSTARVLAAYVQWSSVVAARGNFQNPAMLMSKHWLNAVWSWDHCFNAMALSSQQPLLAWHQFTSLFDHQNERGALPDCASDKTLVWSFCKPPIHGWALQWLLQHGAITREQLQEIYEPLTRWTQWWFDERVACEDKKCADGLPQYLHGNDSGWDNASVFDMGSPVQSPDLVAFLVLQMDALAEIARRLGIDQEAEHWQQRAEALLEKLLARFWLDSRFVALHGHKSCEGDSLLLLIPIVLGERLPKSVQHALILTLKQDNRFLTEHGLASESIASSCYQSDGYWRGPIWAPAVFIIVEGLRALGEIEFADDIARRFCTTVARSGMAENFDALTGAGLRDRAHTWTASIFLLLAHSLKNPEGS